MIEVRGLKKTFDGFAALDGADLSVPHGAVYGLVGPNGAGKTTLLRHLTGVYHQDSGSVTFDGQPVWENVDVKARIASIPDDWFYFMQAGLRDMMRFYRGFYPHFNAERYEKLKEVFALDETRPLRRMSKGQQKQAAFWLAMCTMPDYLILDEPVDGLDPRDAPSGVEPHFAGRCRARHDSACLVAQPARIGGRVRPRGRDEPRQAPA